MSILFTELSLYCHILTACLQGHLIACYLDSTVVLLLDSAGDLGDCRTPSRSDPSCWFSYVGISAIAIVRVRLSIYWSKVFSFFIKTCEAGLVLSVTRILRATLARFRVYVCVYVCMYVCMYVCDQTPPKPLNRFA